MQEKALGAAGLLQFALVDFLRDPMFDAGSAEALEEDVLVPSVSASATGLPNVCSVLIVHLSPRLLLTINPGYCKPMVRRPLSTDLIH